MLRSALVITAVGVGLAWVLAHPSPADRGLVEAALRVVAGGPASSAAVAPGVEAPPPAGVDEPQQVASLGPDSFAIDADRRGQFETTMLIRGRELPALIDTGATYVSLTYDAAASIGIHPTNADFRYVSQTANGTARSAAVVIPAIRVGNVEARNVQAFVSQPGALTGQSLLGMSFLKRLSGFEIEAGRLVLRQ